MPLDIPQNRAEGLGVVSGLPSRVAPNLIQSAEPFVTVTTPCSSRPSQSQSASMLHTSFASHTKEKQVVSVPFTHQELEPYCHFAWLTGQSAASLEDTGGWGCGDSEGRACERLGSSVSGRQGPEEAFYTGAFTRSVIKHWSAQTNPAEGTMSPMENSE